MFLQLHDLRYNNVQDRITLRRVMFFVWKIFPNVSTLDRKRERGKKKKKKRRRRREEKGKGGKKFFDENRALCSPPPKRAGFRFEWKLTGSKEQTARSWHF